MLYQQLLRPVVIRNLLKVLRFLFPTEVYFTFVQGILYSLHKYLPTGLGDTAMVRLIAGMGGGGASPGGVLVSGLACELVLDLGLESVVEARLDLGFGEAVSGEGLPGVGLARVDAAVEVLVHLLADLLGGECAHAEVPKTWLVGGCLLLVGVLELLVLVLLARLHGLLGLQALALVLALGLVLQVQLALDPPHEALVVLQGRRLGVLLVARGLGLVQQARGAFRLLGRVLRVVR